MPTDAEKAGAVYAPSHEITGSPFETFTTLSVRPGVFNFPYNPKSGKIYPQTLGKLSRYHGLKIHWEPPFKGWEAQMTKYMKEEFERANPLSFPALVATSYVASERGLKRWNWDRSGHAIVGYDVDYIRPQQWAQELRRSKDVYEAIDIFKTYRSAGFSAQTFPDVYWRLFFDKVATFALDLAFDALDVAPITDKRFLVSYAKKLGGVKDVLSANLNRSIEQNIDTYIPLFLLDRKGARLAEHRGHRIIVPRFYDDEGRITQIVPRAEDSWEKNTRWTAIVPTRIPAVEHSTIKSNAVTTEVDGVQVLKYRVPYKLKVESSMREKAVRIFDTLLEVVRASEQKVAARGAEAMFESIPMNTWDWHRDAMRNVFLAYSKKTGKYEDIAQAPKEAVIAPQPVDVRLPEVSHRAAERFRKQFVKTQLTPLGPLTRDERGLGEEKKGNLLGVMALAAGAGLLIQQMRG